ncbi:hypothetical protein D3C71_1279160 [compost metagenome]
MFRGRRPLRRTALPLPPAVYHRLRPGRVLPDHARRPRRALWRDCLGDVDPFGLHHDRRGPAWRCGHRRLARADAAGGRCCLVRLAVGVVAGAVFQSAGAAEPGAAVPRAGLLPEAQILAVRADPADGRGGAAPGTGPAERPGGGGTERRQGDHPAPGRQRAPGVESQPLPQTVLPRPGHPRACQFVALPVQRPGRRLLPQRRAVPLPTPVAPARQGLPGTGRIDPDAPAVHL